LFASISNNIFLHSSQYSRSDKNASRLVKCSTDDTINSFFYTVTPLHSTHHRHGESPCINWLSLTHTGQILTGSDSANSEHHAVSKDSCNSLLSPADFQSGSCPDGEFYFMSIYKILQLSCVLLFIS